MKEKCLINQMNSNETIATAWPAIFTMDITSWFRTSISVIKSIYLQDNHDNIKKTIAELDKSLIPGIAKYCRVNSAPEIKFTTNTRRYFQSLKRSLISHHFSGEIAISRYCQDCEVVRTILHEYGHKILFDDKMDKKSLWTFIANSLAYTFPGIERHEKKCLFAIGVIEEVFSDIISIIYASHFGGDVEEEIKWWVTRRSCCDARGDHIHNTKHMLEAMSENIISIAKCTGQSDSDTISKIIILNVFKHPEALKKTIEAFTPRPEKI